MKRCNELQKGKQSDTTQAHPCTMQTHRSTHTHTHYSCMTSSGQHEGCKHEGCKLECWPLEVMQLFCWKFTLWH